MKKILLSIVIIILLGVAYYGISPLFDNVEIQDEAPVAITPTEEMVQTQGGVENLSPEDKLAMETEMERVNSEGSIMMDDSLSELSIELTENSNTDVVDAQEIVFEIMDTVGHPAEGTVRTIETAEGTVIRFENFKTINGPRLNLYLAKDLEATEYIDLGPIRGTEGNINYLVPEGVNLEEYPIVMHWCVPFGVLFNFADLSS